VQQVSTQSLCRATARARIGASRRPRFWMGWLIGLIRRPVIGSLEISQWVFPAERHASEPHPRAHAALARQGRAQLNLPARGIGWFSVARRRDARAATTYRS
jgi:hypothetical protein